MDLLLDTHAIIWFIRGDNKLPDHIKNLIQDPENNIWVSVASIWEIVIKSSKGKLDFNKTVDETYTLLERQQISILGLNKSHLEQLMELVYKDNHSDPFDRLLIAQAIKENLAIVSADRHFTAYPIKVIW